ncbi:MAG TPA: hypothetical protein DCY13_02425 [Verrucomicrobiales bacterium]|nr:hypothetical protein [Verrucomicrobiales bacterium]
MNEQEEAPPEARSGPVDAVRRTAASVLSLLEKRFELAATEFQEQRHRLIDQLVLGGLVLVLALMALITGTFLIVVLTWETAARGWVVAGLTVIYLIGALWGGAKLRRKLADSPPPFAATIEEFRKDRAWFQEKN